MRKQIEAIHSEFLLFAGKTGTRSKFFHERTWYALLKAGFTHSDVDIYLRWIASQNKEREEKYQRKFSIPKMFGDVRKFEAELNEARAWHRNIVAPPTNKELTLQSLRPLVCEEVATDTAQPVASIISRIMQRIQKDERQLFKD